MRALSTLLLLIAACTEPERALPSPSWDGMNEPTPDPADLIAVIGAQGACAEHERPVTTGDQVAATACEDTAAAAAP